MNNQYLIVIVVELLYPRKHTFNITSKHRRRGWIYFKEVVLTYASVVLSTHSQLVVGRLGSWQLTNRSQHLIWSECLVLRPLNHSALGFSNWQSSSQPSTFEVRSWALSTQPQLSTYWCLTSILRSSTFGFARLSISWHSTSTFGLGTQARLQLSAFRHLGLALALNLYSLGHSEDQSPRHSASTLDLYIWP